MAQAICLHLNVHVVGIEEPLYHAMRSRECGCAIILVLAGLPCVFCWRNSTKPMKPLSADQEMGAHLEMGPHPFWILDWSYDHKSSLLMCGAALFVAGFLCSAGDAGAGGVCVSVLMVAGQYSLRDAVPLAKRS